MIGLASELKIVVAAQPIDFRRGMNGLVALVASALASDPYCGDLFIFRAKRCDRLRCIYWDGSMQLSREEFSLLLVGIDWTRLKKNPVKRPTKVG